MNNIVSVAQNHKTIMAAPPLTCSCGEKWFSPFDKLYVSAYNKCVECSTPEELEKFSENIFAIIEA